VAADVSVALGTDAGVQLSNADGVLVLNQEGLAGRVTSVDGTEGIGVEVFGLPGLALDSETGLSFEINTTDAAVDTTVETPDGETAWQLDEVDIDRLQGAADFRVSGTDGTLLRIGGSFTATESDETLEIAGSQVTVDLYAGSIRAITLGSVGASFTLDASAFALDGDLTVDSFFPLPLGQPIPADTDLYVPSTGGFSVSLGPLDIEDLVPVVSSLSFGPDGFEVDTIRASASLSSSSRQRRSRWMYLP
jgi:hypothetical protein